MEEEVALPRAPMEEVHLPREVVVHRRCFFRSTRQRRQLAEEARLVGEEEEGEDRHCCHPPSP